jgi:hypothetical protein
MVAGLIIRKGRNKGIHITQIKEDNEGNNNANTWAPHGGCDHQKDNKNAPPGIDIEFG